MNVKFISKTKKGLKEFNEDSYGYYFNKELNSYIFCVADGVGGYGYGKEASELAVNSVTKDFSNLKTKEFDPLKLLTIFFENANIRLNRYKSLNSINKFGTTLSIMLLIEQYVYFANIGDTRIYSLNQSSIEQKSYDHTLANELKIEKNSHILTKALSGDIQKESAPFILKEKLKSNSFYLITTDGLYNTIDVTIMQKFQNLNLKESAKIVIELANKNQDDVTFQMIKVL